MPAACHNLCEICSSVISQDPLSVSMVHWPFSTMLLYFSLTVLAIDSVCAHGYVQHIIANGQQSLGYDPGFRYQQPPPAVAGCEWMLLVPVVED